MAKQSTGAAGEPKPPRKKAKQTVIDGIPAENVPHQTVEPEASNLPALAPAPAVPINAEETLKKEIAKYNVARDWIARKIKENKKLTIKGIDDKEGIKEVEAAYKEMRDKRLRVEKTRKEIKAPFMIVTKGIDTEANEITELIEPEEKRLGDMLDKIEQEKQEIKDREQREKAEKLHARVLQLLDRGMAFTGKYYTIGPAVSMDVVSLEAMNDAEYAQFLDRVNAEKETIDKIEADRLEAERLEAERNQKEKEKNEAEALKLANEKAEMLVERTAARVEALEGLGMEKTGEAAEGSPFIYRFGDVYIDSFVINDRPADLWKVEYNNLALRIKDAKNLKAKEEAAAEQYKSRSRELTGLGLTFNPVKGEYLKSSEFVSRQIEVNDSEVKGLSPLEWEEFIKEMVGLVKAFQYTEATAKQLKETKAARELEIIQHLGVKKVLGGYERAKTFPGGSSLFILPQMLEADAMIWEFFYNDCKALLVDIEAAEENERKRLENERLDKIEKDNRTKARAVYLALNYGARVWDDGSYKREPIYPGLPYITIQAEAVADFTPDEWENHLLFLNESHEGVLTLEKAETKRLADEKEAARVAALSDVEKIKDWFEKLPVFPAVPELQNNDAQECFNSFYVSDFDDFLVETRAKILRFYA